MRIVSQRTGETSALSVVFKDEKGDSGLGLLLKKNHLRKSKEEDLLMRKLLLLICVLGMPSASWAQSNPAS
jgi:hypothetical protein